VGVCERESVCTGLCVFECVCVCVLSVYVRVCVRERECVCVDVCVWEGGLDSWV